MHTDTFWSLSSTAWTGITTLLTAGLLAVAGAAALYAKKQWETAHEGIEATRKAEAEARDAELERMRPYVIVTVEPSAVSRHLCDLVVRNIGQRPATAISISLDPPPVRAREPEGYELSKARMLTAPVAMIAPGQELRAFYDNHFDRNGRDDLPTSHKVSVSYQDSSDHKYSETSFIDVNAMKGTLFTDVKTVHDIAKSLAEIQKTLGNASVLDRQGTLEVEASVETRVKREERVAEEQADLMRRHQELFGTVPPNGTDAAEPNPDLTER